MSGAVTKSISVIASLVVVLAVLFLWVNDVLELVFMCEFRISVVLCLKFGVGF